MLRSVRSKSTIAVACPGQGILPRGCLHQFKAHQALFQDSLDCVDEALGENFSSYLVELPPEQDPWSLSTANAQPAIVASTFIHYELLRKLHGIDLATGPKVSHLLGHSLGEYSALLLGGALTLSQAVQIVRRRGVLMEELVKDKDYAMIVLVFKPASFESVLEVASARGVLACVNNETQILISGDPKALEQAIDEMNSGKKTILKQAKLPVTIPFHNMILQSIESELGDMVASPLVSTKPIISNHTGAPSSDLYVDTVRANSTPVQWKKSMELLIDLGVTDVVNLGPGSAVDAVNKRFKVTNHAVKTLEDMEKLAALMN